MNKLVVAAIGVIGVFFLIVFIFGMSVWSFNNNCVQQEASIKQQYKQDQNNYDNGYKAVLEVSQIPQKYAEDMKNIYTSAIQGRYGKGGSKAMFQWITEHNPTIDSSVYIKVQQVIQGMRQDFEQNQKQLLDKKMIYEQTYKTFPNSFYAKF